MSVHERLHPGLQQAEFTLDHIIAVPQELVDVNISEIDLTTQLTRRTQLHLPLISSPMDTVTGSRMAILMARMGGIGVIHLNYPTIEDQIKEVERVRRHQAGFVLNPVVISPRMTVADLFALKAEHEFSSFPVTQDGTLATPMIGLVTSRDFQLYDKSGEAEIPVSQLMTPRDSLIVASAEETIDKDDLRAANRVIKEHNKDTLPIVNANGLVVALVTRSDIIRNQQDTLATKDHNKQLKVYAAVDSLPTKAIPRIEAAIAAGVSGIVIDSRGMYRSHQSQAAYAKSLNPEVDVIVGNVVSASAVRQAMDAAGPFIDGFRVGMGTGGICTTSDTIGLGRAVGSATRDIVHELDFWKNKYGHIGVIADGGIILPWHIIASLGLGADAVMMGSGLAGLEESPSTEKWDENLQRYSKSVRGMGSPEVIMQRFAGSVSRYDLYGLPPDERFAEGVSKSIPYKGPGEKYLRHLFAGVRSGFQGINAADIPNLRHKIYFVPRLVAPTKGMS